jgi:hypothetical protein
MSLYTRFSSSSTRERPTAPRGLREHQQAAERLFREAPERPLTREDRTAQAARMIVMEESERRRTLSESLRVARLERTEFFTENAENKRVSKPDR